MPIADQYTCLVVERSSLNALLQVTEKGKTHTGRTGVFLRHSHLDTRTKNFFPMNVIVPKLECAGKVWDGNAKLVKKLEAVQMASAKKILVCSNTTRHTTVGAELGIYPLKTNRDMTMLKWQNIV